MKLIECIKISLIDSIGDIVNILGTEIVERELLSLLHRSFLSISTNTSAKVKIKTISNLHKILKYVTPENRKVYADFYLALKDIVV